MPAGDVRQTADVRGYTGGLGRTACSVVESITLATHGGHDRQTERARQFIMSPLLSIDARFDPVDLQRARAVGEDDCRHATHELRPVRLPRFVARDDARAVFEQLDGRASGIGL